VAQGLGKVELVINDEARVRTLTLNRPMALDTAAVNSYLAFEKTVIVQGLSRSQMAYRAAGSA
jgi:hypothetical protein